MQKNLTPKDNVVEIFDYVHKTLGLLKKSDIMFVVELHLAALSWFKQIEV